MLRMKEIVCGHHSIPQGWIFHSYFSHPLSAHSFQPCFVKDKIKPDQKYLSS